MGRAQRRRIAGTKCASSNASAFGASTPSSPERHSRRHSRRVVLRHLCYCTATRPPPAPQHHRRLNALLVSIGRTSAVQPSCTTTVQISRLNAVQASASGASRPPSAPERCNKALLVCHHPLLTLMPRRACSLVMIMMMFITIFAGD